MGSRSSEFDQAIDRRQAFSAVTKGREFHYWLKDVLDIAIALVTLAALWPVLYHFAGHQVDSPGPAIFGQRRIGER
jgi:lipopolysaccharide/colanic/teichoic acid biosynthesis glycosyltransferase